MRYPANVRQRRR